MKVRELVEKLNENTRVNICDVHYRTWGGFALNHSEEREVVLSKFGDFEAIAFNFMFANNATKQDIVYIHAVVDKKIDLDYDVLRPAFEFAVEE